MQDILTAGIDVPSSTSASSSFLGKHRQDTTDRGGGPDVGENVGGVGTSSQVKPTQRREQIKVSLKEMFDNITFVDGFIFLGLETTPELQKVLFIVLALLYILSVIGNFTVLVIIRTDRRLHTPMYFFLLNLALIEMLYTTAVTPNTLKNLLEEEKMISFAGCFIQMFLFVTLGGTECVLLGIMAYDRYVAICHPLLYTTIMNQPRCVCLALVCWVIGFTDSLLHTILTSVLPYCNRRIIKHYFCEIPSLLNISCKDTYVNEILLFLVGGCIIVGSLTFILISYIFVIAAIMRISTLNRKQKAFSTCTSHLIVVTIFFGTVICIYLQPSSHSFSSQGEIVSLAYVAVTPLINPIIYSFRNKDFQQALEKSFSFCSCVNEK
ncbi:olfactory receptor 2G3-like [Bombina bombina]|uniref:olfactory receptor 2G3-like n=1 Tax=Bombina bombina TaxID=8345 RepID=UPI00235A8D97|nr:olfactory receptor 2G3-like [Bombina bombina]